MASATRGFRRNASAPKAEETKVETKPVETKTEPKVEEKPQQAVEPVTETPVNADGQIALAIKLAAKESEFMRETQSVIAKGREDWQGGPIMSLFALQQTYSDEELSEFPVPGSEAPNNNPDKFKIEYMDGDKRKTKQTNFYSEFAKATPSGKNYLQRIEWLGRVADKGAIKDGIPADILNMTPEQRRTHGTFCEGRIKTMTQAYRNAMRLHFKIKEVEEYGDGNTVTVNPIWAEGHDPEKVTPEEVLLAPGSEPLVVDYQTSDMKHPYWEHYSINAFLKLQPAKAAEKGGGWVNLRDSGATKKAPTPGGKPEKPETLTIKTVETALGTLAELHRWSDEILSQKDHVDYGKLIQALKGKDMDESISALVETRNFLSDLCKKVDADRKYVAMQNSGADLVDKSAA